MAAANEPFQTALLDVRTRVGQVQTTIASIASQVSTLPSRVVQAICDVIPGC